MQNDPVQKRLLIIDDDHDTIDLISFSLSRQGIRVGSVASGEDALTYLSMAHVDLIVISLELPGMSGLNTCKTIRKDTSVPIMFLSAKNEEEDLVEAFSAGGDDFLTKPFRLREFSARIHALLRRTDSGASIGSNDGIYSASGIVIDEGKRIARCKNGTIDLTPREFDLLTELIRNSGRMLSRKHLLQHVWGWGHIVETKTVDMHMVRLRKKLEQVGLNPLIIETIRGYGYRLAEHEDIRSEQ